ncbi:tRNA (adenosine(37)-N6)-dimethylallyltransferase MiaA [Flavobacterium agricola]|uniref:tRNA dimethylallyltransferase n=1 Tax=Flavobacterium agricola TaxID=2870839 RepID=A0ABY6M3B1_9FLAO|nr:tRNA (adenosine(37)-N6)-dimethylallyltransferase MiaA [Flavobacterium agricola]UYW01858.1 tRNA (adenosine(37)-N6)-dimethylallyltransferase MiaA [Flavobacterium agricola]
MANKNYLLTVVGPTAIGKTALAIQLANYYNCNIISCDSRQFYKEMEIGTAVPSKTELEQAPHHFIQNKSIFENYTVGDFEIEALAKLEELFQSNNVQILVGGSGLYVDAVLKGFDEFPEVAMHVRQNLIALYEKNGIAYLQQQLQTLDPEYFTFLQQNNPQTLENPQRMMRFLEVTIGSEKPYSSYLGKRTQTRNFTPIIIGLTADREKMYERINLRVDIMLKNGLLDEVKNLYPNKNLNALQTVGYREIFDYLDGNTDLETATEEIKKNTRRFAKRQITWFKRTENTHWFDYKTDYNEIINTVNSIIQS